MWTVYILSIQSRFEELSLLIFFISRETSSKIMHVYLSLNYKGVSTMGTVITFFSTSPAGLILHHEISKGVWFEKLKRWKQASGKRRMKRT